MFFPGFTDEILAKPAICYIDDSLGFLTKDEDGARAMIHERYDFTCIGQFSDDTNYLLCFFWFDQGDPMVDIWIQAGLESYGPSAPLTTNILVVRQNRFDSSAGVACGDTRIVSGLEEEHRRLLVNQGGTLQHYLERPRPELPNGLIIAW